jgi:hypothetical protein
MSDCPHWLETSVDASDGSPDAVAEVLESVAKTVRRSPEGLRYNLTLELEEVRGDE